jgi:hypothetical protein
MLANEHNNTVEVGMHRALTPSRSRSPAWSEDDNAMQRAIGSQPQYRAPVPTMGNLGQGLSEDEQGATVEVFNLFAGDELQENIHQAAAYAVGAPNVTPRDFIIAWWNSLAGFDSGAEYQLDVIRGLRRAEALAGAFDMMAGE